MSETIDDLFLNGIDATTGRPAFDALTVAELAELARGTGRGYGTQGGLKEDPHRLAEDLAAAGWAVVAPKGLDPAFREAIEPLCARRREQAGPLYKELTFDPDTDDFRSFLDRHGVSFGDKSPDRLPKYLLLLGPPTLIPFEVQCQLALEYGPGRLDFRTAGEYATYAASVLAYETAAAASTRREICFWGPRSDPATELSSTDLLAPLVEGWQGRTKSLGEEAKYPATAHLARDAGKDTLLSALHRPAGTPPPTLLFTASHGAGWPAGHELQAAEQGALITADWTPGDTVGDACRVAASDIGDDARVHGLVAFCFACFGAATPAFDSFARDRSAPRALAPEPFVSALPQRLLAHPSGGALGVFGHVDRAWGFSMRRASDIPQIGPFRNGLLRALGNKPLGDVLADFAVRAAGYSSVMVSRLGARKPPGDAEVARSFIERNDAAGYVLLGDPGACVRRDVQP